MYSAAVTPMLSAAPSISPFTSTVPTVPIGAVAVFAPWLKKAGAICDGITAPVLAPLYSVENGTLTVDCFVSVRTTNAQLPRYRLDRDVPARYGQPGRLDDHRDQRRRCGRPAGRSSVEPQVTEVEDVDPPGTGRLDPEEHRGGIE
ncbi:hypothetical protein NJ76_00140 [Rhodococcus sp. IITR03]|nr:hypothetical protein NJ76_00140 [Rhodococcus sp. IITR03]